MLTSDLQVTRQPPFVSVEVVDPRQRANERLIQESTRSHFGKASRLSASLATVTMSFTREEVAKHNKAEGMSQTTFARLTGRLGIV